MEFREKIRFTIGKSYFGRSFLKWRLPILERLLEKFKWTERRRIFEMFWNLKDFNKQNILLYEATGRNVVKRRRQKNGKGSCRDESFTYWFNCKTFLFAKKIFLDTFQISEGRLKRVLKYKNIFNGLRGRLPGSSRKIWLFKTILRVSRNLNPIILGTIIPTENICTLRWL